MASQAVAAMPALHIVVTCANRKRYDVAARLRLGDLRERRPGLRFAAWTRRLGDAATTASAQDIYAGEHWQIARELPTVAGVPTTLSICSAGYGLIGSQTAISPYAATFSGGEMDSVGDSQAELRDWWSRLTQWPGPAPDKPRSFVDLARAYPSATIVAVLSDAYLRACSDDLRNAAQLLDDDDQFAVIGPPARSFDLDHLIVPVTARLRPVVGGSLQALNVRVAAHLLRTTAGEGHRIVRSILRQHAECATRRAPPDARRRPAGDRVTDDNVRAYIAAGLAAGPTTATRLLRSLRESGRSCEQARFKSLFAEANADAVGN